MRKLLTSLLCVVMVVCMMPGMAWADEGETCSAPNCSHVAAIGSAHYSTLQSAVDAASEGATIQLLKNITLDEAVEIKKSVIIDGSNANNGNSYGEGCYEVNAPLGANGRAFNFTEDTEQSSNVTLKNMRIVGPISADGNTRGISIYQTKDLSLTLENTYVVAGLYAVNIASENENIRVDIKNSKVEGWCSFQTWSPATINVENSILYGTNKYTPDNTYSFATVVVNQNAVASKINITDSKLIAETVPEKKTGMEVLSIQNINNTGSQNYPQGNEIILTNCEIEATGTYLDENDNEVDLEPYYYAEGANRIIVYGDNFYVPEYGTVSYTHLDSGCTSKCTNYH